jgi:ABC-type multidrug transport system fused ATPase/permease subunit
MECSYLQRFNVTSVVYFVAGRSFPRIFNMRSTNTVHHLTPDGVPGDKTNYDENDISVFTAIDDDTRVIPAVEFRNVKFAYDDQIILNDISFRVMRGELLVALKLRGKYVACFSSFILKMRSI